MLREKQMKNSNKKDYKNKIHFKKLKRNTSGITLISLVVTIIVILILAGISLNSAVGNNGIIAKAQEASKKSEMADMKEKVDTANVQEELEDEDVDEKSQYWTDKDDLTGYAGLSENYTQYLKIISGKVYYDKDTTPEEYKEYFANVNIGESPDFANTTDNKTIQINISRSKNGGRTGGPNIIVCLDMSGSMAIYNNGVMRLTRAKNAIVNMINVLYKENINNKTLFSVITFNYGNSVQMVYKPQYNKVIREGTGLLSFGNNLTYSQNYSEAQLLSTEVNKLDICYGPNTIYKNALQEAASQFNVMNEIYNENSDYLVFLSDGDPSDSPTQYTPLVESLKSSGVTIYTIGYGVNENDTTHEKLKNIASEDEETGEKLCYLASDSNDSDIIEVFEEIKSQIEYRVEQINSEGGILTITLDEGYKIDPDADDDNKFRLTIPEKNPTTGEYEAKTYKYDLDKLPIEIDYDEENGIVKWNIRKYRDYGDEALSLLDINFVIIPKED